MIYSKEDVLKFLPHRPPFLFVDQIDEIHLEVAKKTSLSEVNIRNFVGSKVKASFEVKEDLEILKGHFPGNPILPGVVQVEMMAQACPFIYLKAYGDEVFERNVDVALLGIDRARFKLPIKPGASLQLEGELIKGRGEFQTFSCQLKDKKEGSLLASAEVLASIKFLSLKFLSLKEIV